MRSHPMEREWRLNVMQRRSRYSLMIISALAAMGIMVLASTASPAQAAEVSGGGRYIGTFGLAQVSINAVKHSNGSVTGQFEQYNPETGKQYVHGTVTCIDFIYSNTALVIGTITSVRNASVPDLAPGEAFAIVIQDNGQGQAPADRVSLFGYNNVPGESFPCGDPGFDAFAYAALQPLAPLISGNFQVSR
jgi:uncharacterized membrane protein